MRANSYQNHKLASSGAMNQYVAGGENASLIYVTLTVLYEESELTRWLIDVVKDDLCFGTTSLSNIDW